MTRLRFNHRALHAQRRRNWNRAAKRRAQELRQQRESAA